MLSQDNILRIIAKLTAKQVDTAYVHGIVFDPDPH